MAEDRGESLFNVREIGKMSIQMISSITASPVPRADSYKSLRVLSQIQSFPGTLEQAGALLVPALH